MRRQHKLRTGASLRVMPINMPTPWAKVSPTAWSFKMWVYGLLFAEESSQVLGNITRIDRLAGLHNIVNLGGDSGR